MPRRLQDFITCKNILMLSKKWILKNTVEWVSVYINWESSTTYTANGHGSNGNKM